MHPMTRRVLVFLLAAPLAFPVLADGSAKEGRDIFLQKCITCHSIDCNRYGPKLKGLVGRKAGTVSDFSKYSDALKNSGIIWSLESLDRFFINPAALVPGIRQMDQVDLRFDRPTDRKNLVAYLASGDTSLDLCPK